MPLTIVILHIGNSFRIDLDQTARRPQRLKVGIFAEGLMTDKHLRMFEFNVLLLIPENVESRKMNTASLPLLASFLPDALQPAHLIQPFCERFFTVKAAAKIAENIEIITRFKLRLH